MVAIVHVGSVIRRGSASRAVPRSGLGAGGRSARSDAIGLLAASPPETNKFRLQVEFGDLPADHGGPRVKDRLRPGRKLGKIPVVPRGFRRRLPCRNQSLAGAFIPGFDPVWMGVPFGSASEQRMVS